MFLDIDLAAGCKQRSRKLRSLQRALWLSSVALAFTPAMSHAQTWTFTNTGAIQTWVAPRSGVYSVTAIGAQGASAQPGRSGGRGAQVTDSFQFRDGTLYQIAVGGVGTQDGCNGGGGGGTFFVDSSNNPLLVAGGGGGTRTIVSQNGTDASITPYGTTASGSGITYTPLVKSTDLGLGGAVSSVSWGSGGAGFFGDGANDPSGGVPSGGGRSWANGMNGGTGSAAGGFGGGGAGNGGCGGGGGGGYSGGDGGRVAGGGGSFASDANAIFTAGVGVGDGELLITLLRLLALSSMLPSDTPINPTNVAAAIDAFTNAGGTLPAGFQNLFNLTPQQLIGALTQLSGENNTQAQQGAFQMTNSFLSLLTDPFSINRMGSSAMGFAPERQSSLPSSIASAYAKYSKAPPMVSYAPRWDIWGAAFGGSNNTRGVAAVGTNDTYSRVAGVAAGADYRFSPGSLVGFSLAGGNINWSLTGAGVGGLGGGHSDAFMAGIYGKHNFGAGYVSGALTYANYWMQTDRTVTVAGLDQLHADFNAQNFGGRLEGGYHLPSQIWMMQWTPYAAIQGQNFRTPSYGEIATAGSAQFANTYNGRTATAFRGELGGRVNKTIAIDNGSQLGLFGKVAWAHDEISDPRLNVSFIGLPTTSFVVNGATPAHDLALVTGGAEWRLAGGVSFLAKFDGEFANRSQTYSGTGRIRYTL